MPVVGVVTVARRVSGMFDTQIKITTYRRVILAMDFTLFPVSTPKFKAISRFEKCWVSPGDVRSCRWINCGTRLPFIAFHLPLRCGVTAQPPHPSGS